MSDLVDFLKSIVITTIVLDKKYRESVPGLIAEMKTHVDSSGDGQPKRTKKKSRNKKIGRNGLYHGEDEHVRRWWGANKPCLVDDEVAVKPDEVKYHVSCLRTRETELQMILILEILALEKMRPPEDAADSQLPGLQPSPPLRPVTEAPKKRKKHDFPVLLDIHADRLCIWQSTILDEVKALAESQRKGDDTDQSEKANSDPLKDFCIDIIIPL